MYDRLSTVASISNTTQYVLALSATRIGEAAEYLGPSVVRTRKAASEGRLPSRRTGSGHRIFDRADLDAYLVRPASECAGATPERVAALYLPGVGLDRARGFAGPSGKDVAGERSW
ncbi:excisionase family DNA-binding protein [Rhodococcus sp. IEGM 1305]|nr:excisionase family DNA-binding protein [Rhodococcus sp. IEGM 1305]